MKGSFLLLAAAIAVTGNLDAQNNEDPGDPPLSVKNTLETIEEADNAFQERQEEILASEQPVGEPAEEEGTGETAAEDPESSPEGVDGTFSIVEAESGEVPADEAAMEGGASPEADEEGGPTAADETEETADAGNPTEPNLPDEPRFEVPEEDVFLDLPGAEEGSTAVASDAETISVDFPQEDVREIIRSVADLYELNVVIPDNLTGSVSVKLRDVTWEQVFDVVLEPLNFTYILDENIIKIKSLEELAVEPVDTRVFIIDFATAGDIKGSIEPLVDGSVGGRIQVDTRSNALVITERPSRMNNIQEIIETLDQPTEQVMIESKFVEITGRDRKDLGVDWQSLGGYGVELGPFQRDYSDESGREYEDSVESGYEFDSSATPPLTQQDINNLQQVWSGELTRTDTAVFSADSFRTVIRALESLTDVELVSNPTVVTMNNSEAEINIGEEFPIPQYTYNEERGTFEISDFEFKNIGINLNVTPQINSAGFINLNILPEISTRTGEVEFGGASGATIPIITTRKTQSSVTIKSGYTLAIGGLIETRDENTTSSVPLLGDIPGLGRLFSSETKQIDRRNLIVFITAKILSASGATYRDVFSQRTLHEMGIKTRDLPGYEPPPGERELFDSIQASRDEVERLQTEQRLRQQLEALRSVTDKEEDKRDKQAWGEEREIPRRFQ